MYADIRPKFTPYSSRDRAQANNLRRATHRRRGRALTPVALVVERDPITRTRDVYRANFIALPWRERMMLTPRGWQWQPAPPVPTPAPAPDRAGYVRVADTRGRLPDDPRVVDIGGHDTVRYGWVATGWLRVGDMFEIPTGRHDVRQWVAPTGELYVYNKGVTPGDPHTLEVYTYER